MPTLRIFGAISKQHQRLGYLKWLIKKVASTPTSNLDNLGNGLIDVVTRKENAKLSAERVQYIRIRLFDAVYKTIKDQADSWQKNGGEPPVVQMEIQDLYLADPTLPSQVGKLVREDWRFYPNLGTNLGLIRAGTYSINTRAFTLLYLTGEQELRAFVEYLPDVNPLKISPKQRMLFLYCLLENDGEVILPFYRAIISYQMANFNDREAGNLLPDIYRSVIKHYRTGDLPYDIRERLVSLEKTAENIAAQSLKERYAGGTSREHSSRPRLEPFVDIGFLTKPNPMKYEYNLSPVAERWIAAYEGPETSAGIEAFLDRQFFRAATAAWQIEATPLSTPEEIVPRLRKAAKAISSSSGYTPIEEMALLAGIEALLDDGRTFEIATAREALIAYQKANPYHVRFTVNRMGVLAHAKFMDEAPPRSS